MCWYLFNANPYLLGYDPFHLCLHPVLPLFGTLPLTSSNDAPKREGAKHKQEEGGAATHTQLQY